MKMIVGSSFCLDDESGVKEFVKLAKKVMPKINTKWEEDETHEKYYHIMYQLEELNDKTLFVGCRTDDTITIGRIMDVDVESEFGDEAEPYED